MKRIIVDSGNENPSNDDAGAQSTPVSSNSPSPPAAQQQQKRKAQNVLPPELMEILVPSVQVGAVTGTLGLFAGAVGGITRSSTPVLFSTASGIQWFALGSSYYASRAVVVKAWGGPDHLTATDKIQASAIAGGFSGMIGGLLRGPKNIAPGILALSLLGAGGQVAANSMAGFSWKDTKSKIFSSKWSPVTSISDQEYEKFLEKKLLKVEAELALLDDNVRALRSSEHQGNQQTQDSTDPAANGQRK